MLFEYKKLQKQIITDNYINQAPVEKEKGGEDISDLLKGSCNKCLSMKEDGSIVLISFSKDES